MKKTSVFLAALVLIAMAVSYGVSASPLTELLTEPWHLQGSHGAAEAYQSIDPYVLQGKDTLVVTYDLHGLVALGGDASALIFDQGGDWRYVSLSDYGVNGQDGPQTVEIPLSDFPGLDPESEVGTLHTRFWCDCDFVVDITGVAVYQSGFIPFTQRVKHANCPDEDPPVAEVGIFNDSGNPVPLHAAIENKYDGSDVWEAIAGYPNPTCPDGQWCKAEEMLPVGFTGLVRGHVTIYEEDGVTVRASEVLEETYKACGEPTCDKNDFVAEFQGNQAMFTNHGLASCYGVFAVYNTHGHASLEEGPQSLIGYRYGQIMASETITLTVDEHDPAEGCYVQLDGMIVANEEDVAATVPDPLTKDNQGPQWEALILAETHGDHVCEDVVINNLYLPLINKLLSQDCGGETLTVDVGSTSFEIPYETSASTRNLGLWPLGTVVEMDSSLETSWSVSSGWYHYLPVSQSYRFKGLWPLSQENWDADPIELRAGIQYLIRSWFYQGDQYCSASGWVQWDP